METKIIELSELKALTLDTSNDHNDRSKVARRIHAQLAKVTSMTSIRIRAHFSKAMTLLSNEEKLDQGFETCNSNMIEHFNKLLHGQSKHNHTEDAMLLKYSIFLLNTASYRVRRTQVRNFIVYLNFKKPPTNGLKLNRTMFFIGIIKVNNKDPWQMSNSAKSNYEQIENVSDSDSENKTDEEIGKTCFLFIFIFLNIVVKNKNQGWQANE